MTESTHKPFLVRPPPKLLSLPGATSDCVVKFATYHPHYKEKLRIIESTYNPFLLRSPPKLISPLRASSDYIVKIMKLPRCVPKAGKHLFAVHHPHYKEELRRTSAAYDPCLHYSSDKLRTIASVYQPKASFVPSHAAQTIEFSPDNNVLLNKRLKWQITDKSCGLRYNQDTLLSSQIGYVICLANTTNKANIDWYSMKCKRVTRIVIAAELYHNLAESMTKARASSTLRSQHYGMVRTGEHGTAEHGTAEHGTGKYETGEYGHLTIF